MTHVTHHHGLNEVKDLYHSRHGGDSEKKDRCNARLSRIVTFAITTDSPQVAQRPVTVPTRSARVADPIRHTKRYPMPPSLLLPSHPTAVNRQYGAIDVVRRGGCQVDKATFQVVG